MSGYDLCRRISDVVFDMIYLHFEGGKRAMDTVIRNVLQKPKMTRNTLGQAGRINLLPDRPNKYT